MYIIGRPGCRRCLICMRSKFQVLLDIILEGEMKFSLSTGYVTSSGEAKVLGIKLCALGH